MRVFALTLPNNTYPQLPEEDIYNYGNNGFCVADGITRDPLTDPNWRGQSVEERLKHYPNPSPATAAAQKACQAFTDCRNAAAKSRLITANNAVGKINKGLDCDYLANDFAGCVMAGVVLKGNRLSWAAVGDCQLVIFNNDGILSFISPNGLEEFDRYMENSQEDWGNPARRVEVRKEFRNNPKKVISGKKVSYGALTGEKVAEQYIMHGEIKVEAGSVLVLLTDGFAGYVNHPEFLKRLQLGKEVFTNWSNSLAPTDSKKYGRERTVLVISGF